MTYHAFPPQACIDKTARRVLRSGPTTARGAKSAAMRHINRLVRDGKLSPKRAAKMRGEVRRFKLA